MKHVVRHVVAALLIISMGAAPDAEAATPTPGRHPYGVQLGGSTPALGKLVNSAWTVVDMPWPIVERVRGTYDFAAFDSTVKELAAAGVQPQLRLSSCALTKSGDPFWGTYPLPSGSKRRPAGTTCTAMPPRAQADWYNFVFRVVTHYKNFAVPIKVFAFNNEVNDPGQWPGIAGRQKCIIGATSTTCPVFDDYATMLKTAYKAVHAANPAGIVLDSGIGSPAKGTSIVRWKYEKGGKTDTALRQSVRYLNQYFSYRHAPGEAPDYQYIDPTLPIKEMRAEFHRIFYAPWDPPATSIQQGDRFYWITTQMYKLRDAFDGVQMHFYDYTPSIVDLLAFQRAHGSSKPVYCWECGIKWPVKLGTGKLYKYDPALAASWVKLKSDLGFANGVVQMLWVPMIWNKAPTTRERYKNLPLVCGTHSAGEPTLCPPDRKLSNVGAAFYELTR